MKASLATGRIIVLVDGKYMAQASAVNRFAKIGLFGGDEFSSGEEIEVIHVLESGARESTRGEVLTKQNRFRIRGETTFTSQDTGEKIEGFVRESSRGPLFTYRECCEDGFDAESPRTVTVDIRRQGQTYDTVTLTERRAGYYEGRWDFYKQNVSTPDGVWPPPANYEYTAVLSRNTCSEVEVPSKRFNVLTGQPRKDSTKPDIVEVTLDPGGLDERVTAGSNKKSVEVEPGKELPVKLFARDRKGLEKIAFEGSTAQLSKPISETATAKVPVPGELTLSTTLSGLGPREEVRLSGEATNFSGLSAETKTLTIEGKHPKPTITDIEPEKTFSSNELPDIEGKNLKFSSTVTEVIFSIPSLGISDKITKVSQGTPTKLTDVTLPGSIKGNKGKVEVQVRTFIQGDRSTAKTSNTETFWLLDRQRGSFTEYQANDFKLKSSAVTQCSTSAPVRGAITDVKDIRDAPKSPRDALAIFKYGKNKRETVRFDTKRINDNEYGGVIVGPKCRAAIILSHDESRSSSSNKMNSVFFRARALYFPAIGPIVRRADIPMELVAQTKSKAFVVKPQESRLYLSEGETVVGVASLNPSVQNTDFTQIAVGLYDLYAGVYGNDVKSNSIAEKGCLACGSAVDWLTGKPELEVLVDGSRIITLSLLP